MKVLVAGGAGFIGSHLCRALSGRGDEVHVIDNFITGKRSNLEGLDLTLHEADLCRPETYREIEDIDFDGVINLASPASPVAYNEHPLETLDVGSLGTRLALEIAKRCRARFVMASTSEIYGEPQVHPQTEDYRGNVSSIGPRSMYDEAKRFSEALTVCYGRLYRIPVGIVRIFNTYGPYMQPDDGRVITNFMSQLKSGRPLTVYGKGLQTRSFCYASDLVRGLMAMLDCREPGPINLGNPAEINMLELIEALRKVTGLKPEIIHCPLPGDDPTRRCPDISRAKKLLSWTPCVPLEEGLQRTWEWFRNL